MMQTSTTLPQDGVAALQHKPWPRATQFQHNKYKPYIFASMSIGSNARMLLDFHWFRICEFLKRKQPIVRQAQRDWRWLWIAGSVPHLSSTSKTCCSCQNRWKCWQTTKLVDNWPTWQMTVSSHAAANSITCPPLHSCCNEQSAAALPNFVQLWLQ